MLVQEYLTGVPAIVSLAELLVGGEGLSAEMDPAPPSSLSSLFEATDEIVKQIKNNIF